MTSASFHVESTRGGLAESVHRVSVAVVDRAGRLVARAGDPDLVTWWRSAAKPFQALPMLIEGAADRFQLDQEELALTCASHSSEPRHLEVVSRYMSRVGVTDADLACGLHPPLSPTVAREVACGTALMTPRWSNCSGKHTGMLALARHMGWPLQGYNAAGHPVQERILDQVARWSGWERSRIAVAPDGCTAVCFALPLHAMARAYAALADRQDPSLGRLATAMMTHPFLVAGTGRLCTDLMTAWPGRVIAKVGADGIYCAALPDFGLGVALKVEDGDSRSSAVALLGVLGQLLARVAPVREADFPFGALTEHARPSLRNTRDVVTGHLQPAGSLQFLDA